jgi:hypothetical protein
MVLNGVGYNNEWLLSFETAATLAETNELKLDYPDDAARLLAASELLELVSDKKEDLQTERAAKKAAPRKN